MRFQRTIVTVAAVMALAGTIAATTASAATTYSVTGQRMAATTSPTAALVPWYGNLRSATEIGSWTANFSAPFANTPTVIAPSGTFDITSRGLKGAVTGGTIVPLSARCGTRNYDLKAQIAFADGSLGELAMTVTAYQFQGMQCYTYMVVIKLGTLNQI